MEPSNALQDGGLACPVRVNALPALAKNGQPRIVQKYQKSPAFGFGGRKGLTGVGQAGLVGANKCVAVVWQHT